MNNRPPAPRFRTGRERKKWVKENIMLKSQCAKSGCEASIPKNHLMCPAHCRTVPKPLQDAVCSAYDNYTNALPDALSPHARTMLVAYYKARKDAVEWANREAGENPHHG